VNGVRVQKAEIKVLTHKLNFEGQNLTTKFFMKYFTEILEGIKNVDE
jgi:hypothetical protein